jgi:hypothetical protein
MHAAFTGNLKRHNFANLPASGGAYLFQDRFHIVHGKGNMAKTWAVDRRRLML